MKEFSSIARGKIIILSGPSGSGKTTLHKKLLESKKLKGELVKSISATTRPRRVGEKSGRDYLFLTPRQFLYKTKAGYFLEWQKVFDHYYGTPKHCVDRHLKAGCSVLLCIDVKGAAVVRRQHPDSAAIFIKPPSLAILKKRLLARGSENVEAVSLRLKTARREMKEASGYDYVVVNNDLKKAFKKLEEIALSQIGAIEFPQN